MGYLRCYHHTPYSLCVGGVKETWCARGFDGKHVRSICYSENGCKSLRFCCIIFAEPMPVILLDSSIQLDCWDIVHVIFGFLTFVCGLSCAVLHLYSSSAVRFGWIIESQPFAEPMTSVVFIAPLNESFQSPLLRLYFVVCIGLATGRQIRGTDSNEVRFRDPSPCSPHRGDWMQHITELELNCRTTLT